MRVAGVGDLMAVIEIHARHNGGPHQRAPTGDELVAWDRMMHTADLTVYLAEVESRPAGTATTVVVPNITYACRPTLLIEAVVVVPDVRRQGVATAIMDHIIGDARAAGCHKLQLLSHKRHAYDGGHRLYQRCGFEAEAEGFRRYL